MSSFSPERGDWQAHYDLLFAVFILYLFEYLLYSWIIIRIYIFLLGWKFSGKFVWIFVGYLWWIGNYWRYFSASLLFKYALRIIDRENHEYGVEYIGIQWKFLKSRWISRVNWVKMLYLAYIHECNKMT